MPPRPKLPESAKRPTKQGDDTPDEETLLFEAQVLREVAGVVSGALEKLIRTILVSFEALTLALGTELNEEQARILGEALASRIRAFRWNPMKTQLRRASVEAHRLGVRRAAERFASPADRAKAMTAETPQKRAVPDPDTALRELLYEAAKLAKPGIRTNTELAAVAAKVSAGKARIEGHARWVANAGINAGAAAVARKMGLRLLWVAERNACLHCLAHAGYVVDPGGPFPPLSFDPNAKGVATVRFPPLHPNCRCQVRTTDAPSGPPPLDRSSLNPAARLAAEARRSVVYQWTEYASSPAMARAAEALLSAGAGLPASVESRARRMLRKKK